MQNDFTVENDAQIKDILSGNLLFNTKEEIFYIPYLLKNNLITYHNGVFYSTLKGKCYIRDILVGNEYLFERNHKDDTQSYIMGYVRAIDTLDHNIQSALDRGYTLDYVLNMDRIDIVAMTNTSSLYVVPLSNIHYANSENSEIKDSTWITVTDNYPISDFALFDKLASNMLWMYEDSTF